MIREGYDRFLSYICVARGSLKGRGCVAKSDQGRKPLVYHSSLPIAFPASLSPSPPSSILIRPTGGDLIFLRLFFSLSFFLFLPSFSLPLIFSFRLSFLPSFLPFFLRSVFLCHLSISVHRVFLSLLPFLLLSLPFFQLIILFFMF